MKEFFKNRVRKNTAKITLKSKNKIFSVYFHLNDNPVQHLWQKIHTENKKLSTRPMANMRSESILFLLNSYLKKVGANGMFLPISQKILNDLHSKFVHQGNNFNQEWQMINILIHRLEDNLDDPFIEYDCDINFVTIPNETYFPIKEEYKLWLNTEHRWGDLILGFGTLGKDWLDIFKDNDNFDDLNIQSTVSSETRIFFHLENPYRRFEEKEFYLWAKNNKVPLDNLNFLSLGKYILGQIIITEEFLSFNPNISDWYVPNHVCKLNWNKEFIGDDLEVLNVDFFNSDMYYESLINHANISSLL